LFDLTSSSALFTDMAAVAAAVAAALAAAF